MACRRLSCLQVQSWTYSAKTRTVRAAARSAREAGVRVRELKAHELTEDMRRQLQHEVSGAAFGWLSALLLRCSGSLEGSGGQSRQFHVINTRSIHHWLAGDIVIRLPSDVCSWYLTMRRLPYCLQQLRKPILSTTCLTSTVAGDWLQQKAVADRELRVFVRNVDYDNLQLQDGVRIFVAEQWDPAAAPPAVVDPVLQVGSRSLWVTILCYGELLDKQTAMGCMLHVEGAVLIGVQLL